MNLFIYVTRQTGELNSGMPTLNPHDLSEKSPVETTGALMEPSILDSEVSDIEKGGLQDLNPDDEFSHCVRPGRPDINNLIAASIANVSNHSPDDRIIIGVCGPIAMTNATREAVSKAAHEDGLSITQYTEVSIHEVAFVKF